MVRVTFTDSFEKEARKIKDASFKDGIRKHIEKILENPLVGKPLRKCKLI